MTEFYMGRRTQFSYAIGAGSYGTPNPATDWSWLGYVEKVSPGDTPDIKEISAMDEVDTRDVSGYDVLVKRYSNTINFKVQHFRHLVLAYGDAVDTKTGSSPYVHTIGLEADTLPSYSFETGYQHTSPFGIRYDGNVVKTYEIGSSKGDFVRAAFNNVAKTGTKITSYKGYQTAAPGLQKYTPAQLPIFKHQHVTAVLGGVDYSVHLNQWKLMMDNGVVADPHDEDTISEPIPGLRTWSGSLDINMSTSAIWDLKEAGAATTLVITLQKTASDKCVFTVNNPLIEVSNPPFDIEQGLVNITVPFKCDSITPVVTDAISADYDAVEA